MVGASSNQGLWHPHNLLTLLEKFFSHLGQRRFMAPCPKTTVFSQSIKYFITSMVSRDCRLFEVFKHFKV
jgi:hypothetical protein